MSRPAKKKTTKKESNPIVAVALKVIPKKYAPKAKRWIKSHNKLIYLTINGVASLYGLYLLKKYNIRKKFKEQDVKYKEASDAMLRMNDKQQIIQKKIGDKVAEIVIADHETKAHNFFQSQRLAKVEKALTNRDFHEFLAKTQNIKDVQMINKSGVKRK